MLKIQNVFGLAKNSGIIKGDIILEINGHKINTFLDLQFYGADEQLEILIRTKDGISKNIVISQDWETPLGIEPVEHQCRTCANNCVFCFIDQMHPNLRKSLYLKDDDYNFSFIYGNFITLTNLSERDFQKIIEQKLSPLYISVQATNPVLHKKMMRYKHDFNILEKLQILSENNIDFHTQIVVVPHWNDKNELENSLKDLTNKNLNTLSIGVVPVGLTKFRSSLLDIEKMTEKEANDTLQLCQNFEKTYCSDEIYLLANAPIPPEDFYNGYPQLENGIGMIRLMLENWKSNKNDFIADITKLNEHIVFITGKSAEKYFLQIANEINEILPNKTRVKAIENKFFGKSVTVAGLLTAQDILTQTNLQNNEIIAIPSSIFNHENMTLDNVHFDTLKEKFNHKLIIIDEEFDSWEIN
ncbi:MAG: DUF512 domain-containing protein [Candidatus Cloacimonetes bacterium]|jgi:putative radical SAM enzyme (TIGR03279 family)|nr:DUF512 domain-containing protein [Candidatus Cloacimonadota bacterium]MBT7470145.1 DUF512 domain-containing protein [Candidatus Cloacimonadota bacterium]